MKNSKATQIILLVCRLLFGFTFIFSGFVKAVDPLGTAYKVNDYLVAFGMEDLAFLSLACAFILITVEFCIGFCMTLGIFLKQTSWVAALFMLVMTPLTLYLAIADPVSDCGCFGDAVVLTNWQTFYKNVILDVILIAILICMRTYRPWLQPVPSFIAVGIGVIAGMGLQIHCYRHLPIIDFRPYKVGNNIAELMTIPEGMPADRYDISFIYEKDGVQKEFTLENYPADDSTWVFVEQKSVLVEKGYEPPIHDFSLTLPEMGDVTDLVLENPGYTFLLVSTKLEDCDTGHLDEINSIHSFARDNGIAFYGMTASTDDVIETFKAEHDLEFPIATSDETMLKTVIRSNPGLVLLKNATVTGKWHYNDLPSPTEIESIIKQ